MAITVILGSQWGMAHPTQHSHLLAAVSADAGALGVSGKRFLYE